MTTWQAVAVVALVLVFCVLVLCLVKVVDEREEARHQVARLQRTNTILDEQLTTLRTLNRVGISESGTLVSRTATKNSLPRLGRLSAE